MSRPKVVTAIGLAFGLASVAAVIALQQHADGRRTAQVGLQSLRTSVAAYELLPWKVDAADGGSPGYARFEMARLQRQIAQEIDHLERVAPSPALVRFESAFARSTRALVHTRELLIAGIRAGDLAAARVRVLAPYRKGFREATLADQALQTASVQYSQEARRSMLEAAFGSALAVLALVAGFSFFFRRWTRARIADERSRERLNAVVANMPGVVYRIVQVDGEWTIEFMSDHIEVMTGHDAAYFTNAHVDTFRAIVHPDDRALLERQFEAATEAEEPFALEYRLIDAAGDVRWVYERAAEANLLHDGSLVLDGIIFDVTDRRTAEQERDSMEQDLRIAQKLEAVGQLAAGIAHEINTPVQFVGDSVRFLDDAFTDIGSLLTGYRRLLTDAHVSEQAIAELEEIADLSYLRERMPSVFTRIYDGVERVASLVKAMKSFAHPSQAERVPADLNEALRTTLTVARNEYKYVADIHLDLHDLPPVLCNVGDINQIFLNLIVNAAHAIEDAHGADAVRGTIRITSDRADGEVCFRFADNGCGVPPEISERIFDPFFTTKEVGRGSGQGLSLSRTIAQRHGGRLACESAPGRGSTFTLHLPIEAAVQVDEAMAA